MFEWRVACDQDWDYSPGVLGRGLKGRLPADRWTALERTFVGANIDENWEALFLTADLFLETAREVADMLDLVYPQHLANDVMEYLKGIHRLE
jgi:aminoglycoside 6-adenylyltransferase